MSVFENGDAQGVEKILSISKHHKPTLGTIDFLAEAKTLGYEIILVYIHLQNIELNQTRAKQRVRLGDHNTPADKIRSHLSRTQQYIKQALSLMDIAQFDDHSSQQQSFLFIAQLNKEQLSVQKASFPAWAENMLDHYL